MTNLPRSEATHARARKVMPGGNTRSTVYEAPHPIYLASGEGAYVIDVDGQRYLDFQNNFTALIHGHRHPGVTTALAGQLAKGVSFSNPTLAEIDLAEILCERVPYFEHARFTNTGSEAVMTALKAARALTGRQIIVKCEGAYHGNYDYVEMSVSDAPETWTDAVVHGRPAHRGVALGASVDVVLVPFNDIEITRLLLDRVADRVAAVLIDPLPSRIGLIPATPEYLEMLRRWTSANGALLVTDEVLSFRLGYGGALGTSTVHPDLCVFGKIIGGGLPIGAVAGPAEVMKVFDPSDGAPLVSHSGTFTANPLSMVAGAAAMSAMRPSEFERLDRLGERARVGLTEVLADLGVEGVVTGTGSLFRFYLGRSRVESYRDAFGTSAQRHVLESVIVGMRREGVLISKIGLGALSTPMTPFDIDHLHESFRRTLRESAR